MSKPTQAPVPPESAPSAPLDPMDFFPFRGQYGGPSTGALLFVSIRAAIPLLFYSLLAPTTSPLSIFSALPSAFPSRPPPALGPSIPGLPDATLQSISQTLGLSPYGSLVFLGAALPSLSFSAYNLLWRRERFPMSGQGGSVQVTTQVNLIDAIHAFLYVYLAARNPTWSPEIFRWMPSIFVVGLGLHVAADHGKYLFRKDPENERKVYTGGVWRLVRHPNFLGFTIWRIAFATAAGGWAFGLFMGLNFGYLFWNTAVPILEGYMGNKYGKQWETVTEKVHYKMIPGIW